MSDRPIASPRNPRVKQLVRLRERRHRDELGLFPVEGSRELHRAMDAGIELAETYFCPALARDAGQEALLHRIAATGSPLVELAESPFRKASYRQRPEGVLAVARQFATDLAVLDPGADPLLLVVESIEKPGNLGTMLRTAEAAGAAAVIVADPATDLFNPNVVRASLGCLFVVPVAVATTPRTIRWLRGHHVRTFAATPGGGRLHWEADYRSASAIVVGSEHYGLADAWMQGADERVRIPMAGEADSLNAATAAAVLLYEAVRQRSRPPGG